MHFQAASLLAIALSGLAQAASTNVTLDGRTFVNKGLVAFGRIPNDARDSYGETLGGLGSSIALDSVYKKFDGSFAGKIQLNPDRGHNTQVTTDYRARSHAFTFSFSPLATDFNNGTSDENLQLAYESSLIYREGINFGKSYKNFTTGLDPDSVRNATSSLLSSFPALPLRASDNHIPFDLEGMAITRDGLIRFVSDEYGPYIYVTEGPTGHVIGAVAPPNAILPIINGKLNFTAEVNPDTGRQANQGFEGLTLDRNTNTLWALLQSATIQDSNKGSKTTIRYTRILGYDVSNVLKPKLVHEYVVPLPISSKGNVRKASELHIVDSETFLILSRDGSGFGDTDPKSTFKQADLISTKNATDIANTKYDEPANPISPNGVLVSDITPVQYQSFVDLVNKDELAKFGLQSGGAFDKTLIASKLESLALASCQDSKNPNDYFLFVVSDNDFITQNGFQASQVANGSYVVEPYSDPYPGGSADTQAFIYRVTLPINGRAQPGYN